MKEYGFAMIVLGVLSSFAVLFHLIFGTPGYAREYCPRPPHMQTTQSCERIPTEAVPYCPAP